MPCKKMSKDVSIPTFTIQYLMESGQGLTSNFLWTIGEKFYAVTYLDSFYIFHFVYIRLLLRQLFIILW